MAGRLELTDDVDAFSFTALGGHIYGVVATAGMTSAHLFVDIRSNTSVLTQGTGSAAALLQVSGTYQATVTRGNSYSSGMLPYTLVVSDLGTDDHGNLSSQATPIALGQSTAGDLQYATDSDWFSTTVTANHVYQVSCVTAFSQCPVNVIDPSGAQVHTGYGSGPRSFLASQSGVAAFEVQAQSASFSGPFTVTVTDLGPEDHGATLATATPYPTLGVALPGALRFAGDVDLFSFTATAGRIYAVSCSGPSSCPAAMLDGAGNTLASTSYGGNVARGLARTSGPHYARVGEQSGQVLFSYTLTVTDVGVDDHANTAAGATPITAGTPVTGEVQYQQDVDVLALTAVTGRIYRVQCATTAGQCGLAVRAGTTTVAQAYQAATATVTFEAPTAALTIEVSSGSTATWSVEVTDLGVDDHGDTAATGTALTLGAAPAAGAIEVSGDVDVFTVANVAANDVILFTCQSANGCSVAAQNPVGIQVASDYGSGASPLVIGFRAAVPGTYSFAVRAYSTGGTSTYTVRAEAGTDDHADTTAAATPVSLGVATAGVINFPSDVDVFSIALTAASQRSVTLSGSSVRGNLTGPSGSYVGYVSSSYPFTFTPSMTGTYVIQVTRDYGTAAGYILTVN
ncbi:MAG: hypothetical protein AB1938_17700 [Myxococcota bacterium]